MRHQSDFNDERKSRLTLGVLTPVNVRKSFLVFALACLGSYLAACGTTPEVLILATTTSTADSGLLEEILPGFEREANVKVQVLAVGTGQALAIGERGDADVLLIHDTRREEAFVADGFGEFRLDLMYNDFVILGPPDDPAGIRGISSAVEALTRLFNELEKGEGDFVSRGDQSGTHSMEMNLWDQAGIAPSGAWYRETGQGMGNTLTVAGELQGYTLSDRGTYLARKEKLDLDILVEGDPMLRNQYGILALNAELHPHIKVDLAQQFIDYVTRADIQERIGKFGVDKFGKPLFHPNAR